MSEQAADTKAPEPPEQSHGDNLTVHVDIFGENKGFAPNSITTTLYSWWSFPTLGLLELLYPWKKFANFYFFCVGLMQTWKEVSLTSGQPSSWMTLTFICLFEMFFKGKEELQRFQGDRATNREPVEVLTMDGGEAPQSARFTTRTWADVKVGDVVRVHSRETFPADLLLLRGSDPPGQCWVNTKPLDGETDTKLRLVPKKLADLLEKPESCEPGALVGLLSGGYVRCEEPNDKVNDVTAQLVLPSHVLPERLLVSEDNYLLRGCQLRNTDWVLGLVTATGVQSKINYYPGAERVGKPRPLSQALLEGLSDLVSGKGAQPKAGRTSKMVNTDIIGVVVWLVVICLLGALLYVVWEHETPEGTVWYLGDDTTVVGLAFIQMTCRFFLICYQFVPISLYVSMMFYQTICRAFVLQDIHLYDAKQDEPCQVRQMALLDELGQVSHIFSDKTGTLTSNHMEFRRAFVVAPDGAGLAFGCGETAISQSLAEQREAAGGGVATAASVELRTERPSWASCKPKSATYCNYDEALGTPSLFDAVDEGGAMGQRIRELMLAMAVNHSVLLEMVHGREELSASSPDELAFVAAAEYFGFEFVQRDADRGLLYLVDKLDGMNTRHAIELLYAFPYESSRKRMSVIVRLPADLLPVVGGTERVRLYTKGADSVLCDLSTGVLAPTSPGANPKDMAVLDELLADWADIALRTLVFAKREMPEFEAWSAKYEAAIADPENVRKAKLKEPNAISDLQSEIESKLTLQGATAIEDKLQDGVPEILKDLRSAGVKVWMLTGDKVGTAKNIATACNILPADADTLELTTETHPVLAELKAATLVRAQKALAAAAKAPPGGGARRAASRPAGAKVGSSKKGAGAVEADAAVRETTRGFEEQYPDLVHVREALEERERAILERVRMHGPEGGGGAPMCLVLDEKAIEYCGLLCKTALATVGFNSRSVVACRARKDQKAELLNLIKINYPDSCCLAIGDGANDVAMIRQGHIGVGIIGKEGMQAVNNSDFAIGEFQMLRHLLFVHGRFAYRRTALFCYYMFYKNIANVLAMYLFTLVARASGERLFVQLYLEFYNIFFTSLPIILFASFDQDVTKEAASRDPTGYTPGILRTYYTHTRFVRWMVEATFLAALTTYVPALGLGYPGWSLSSPANGDPGVNSISMTSMSLVVVGVNLRLAVELHSWSGLECVLMLFSLLAIELCCLLFSFVWYPESLPTSFDWNDLHGVVGYVWDDFYYWLCCILVLVLALGPKFVGLGWDMFFAADFSRCLRTFGTSRILKMKVMIEDDARFPDRGVPHAEEVTTAASVDTMDLGGSLSPAQGSPSRPPAPAVGAQGTELSTPAKMPSTQGSSFLLPSEDSSGASIPASPLAAATPGGGRNRTRNRQRQSESVTFSINESANRRVMRKSVSGMIPPAAEDADLPRVSGFV